MSFVTTHPEALAALAGNLQVLGTAMAAQNAAAAAPTTGVVPAAADGVSALQATVFDAYGTLYQQISAEATAIHEMFVQTLRASADSYQETEAANQIAAGSSASSSSSTGLTDILGSTGPLGLSGNAANIGNIGLGNTASAASDLLGLASGGLLSNTVAEPEAGAAATAGALASAGAGMGPAALGAGPVAVTVGQAPSISGVSVPPSWAASTATSTVAPTTLTTAGWTAATPHSAPLTAIPAGMPGATAAARGGLRFGTPRYGVKPVVMPHPAVG